MLDTDTKRRIGTDRDNFVGKVTLIDFKTIRYRNIIQSLFPGRTIEGYLLFVDEPHRVVTVL